MILFIIMIIIHLIDSGTRTWDDSSRDYFMNVSCHKPLLISDFCIYSIVQL